MKRGKGKRRMSMHDAILIVVAFIVLLVMSVSACLLDSPNWKVFMAIIVICSLYMYVFAYANGGANV